jgi:cyclic-di-GMP-binding protein
VRQVATITVGISSRQSTGDQPDDQGEGTEGCQLPDPGRLRCASPAKKRDDLQAVMALLKGADLEVPVQFNNFRD